MRKAGKPVADGSTPSNPIRNTIKVQAQVIEYRIKGDETSRSVSHFSKQQYRIDVPDVEAGDQPVIITFDGAILPKDAVAALQRVIADIEARGLPETKGRVLRRHAAALESVYDKSCDLIAQLAMFSLIEDDLVKRASATGTEGADASP